MPYGQTEIPFSTLRCMAVPYSYGTLPLLTGTESMIFPESQGIVKPIGKACRDPCRRPHANGNSSVQGFKILNGHLTCAPWHSLELDSRGFAWKDCTWKRPAAGRDLVVDYTVSLTVEVRNAWPRGPGVGGGSRKVKQQDHVCAAGELLTAKFSSPASPDGTLLVDVLSLCKLPEKPTGFCSMAALCVRNAKIRSLPLQRRSQQGHLELHVVLCV